ncbi:hypothetical protein C8J57DRAFT_1306221 [Mycena rebaudengoi]|nr:hypothetical protein C8J57DRAFT_1306221 [Mycena rebaudengoi]
MILSSWLHARRPCSSISRGAISLCNRPLYSQVRRYGLTADEPKIDSSRERLINRTGRTASTLKPRLLRARDFLDLSQTNHRGSTVFFNAGGVQLRYRGRIPFPPHSRGFLYYHSDPTLSPLAGSVRLRTTTSDAPSSFPQGQDLLSPTGMSQLLNDRLVTPDQLSRCHTLFANRIRVHAELILFGLSQPFPVNFSTTLYLTIVGPTALHPIAYSVLSHEPGRYSFTGTAIARFERSTLPEHAGKRPDVRAEYAGRHKDGELFTLPYHSEPGRLLSFNVDGDGPTAAALRVLWDT